MDNQIGPWMVHTDNAVNDLVATAARTLDPFTTNGKWCFLRAMEAYEKAIASRPYDQPVAGHLYFPLPWIASSGFPVNGNAVDGRFQEAGITHAVNLCELRDYGPQAQAAGIKYLNLGTVPDDGTARPPGYWKALADFFLPDYGGDSKILINCAAGASRSPSAVYFLIRAATKMPSLEAKAAVYAANQINGRNCNVTYGPWADEALIELGLV